MKENARMLYAAVLLQAANEGSADIFHEMQAQALASEIDAGDLPVTDVIAVIGDLIDRIQVLLNNRDMIWPELVPGPVPDELKWDALVDHVSTLAHDGIHPNADQLIKKLHDDYLYGVWFWQDEETPMGNSISIEETSWMNFVDDLLQVPGWELAEIVNGPATRLISRRVAETIHAMNQANYLHKHVIDYNETLIDDDIFQMYEDAAAKEGAKWRRNHPIDPQHRD